MFKRKVASDIVYLTWLPESRVARQVHRAPAEEDGDHGRPVFPEPPQPLPLVSQGTPTAGRILNLDLGSRSSVVSRLSGPVQVGEI